MCLLQKRPQVALNPHCRPSSVLALHRWASWRTALTRAFLVAGGAAISLVLGLWFVSWVLCRAAANSRAFSRDRSIVSAIFSGCGCPEARAAWYIRCHISPPCGAGTRTRAAGAAFLVATGGGLSQNGILFSGVEVIIAFVCYESICHQKNPRLGKTRIFCVVQSG